MKQQDLEAALRNSAQKSSPPPATRRTKGERESVQRQQAKTREGKTQVAGHFLPENGRTLRLIALEHSTTSQALLEEALQDLFRKYNKEWIE